MDFEKGFILDGGPEVFRAFREKLYNELKDELGMEPFEYYPAENDD